MTLSRQAGALSTLLLAQFVAAVGVRAQQPSEANDDASQAASFAPADVEFFEKQVRPLLAARCHKCHSAKQQKGNLRLDSREFAIKGGDTAPAVVPGKPDESLLVDAIRYGDTYQMPPKSQLPGDEVDTLVEWVRRGAPWGEETATDDIAAENAFDMQARASHWCFQPLSDARPPELPDISWIGTPVDRFILARLQAADLSPAEVADKRTLLRRVTFDLTGLPPTPDEIDAFLADTSEDAYEKVVDRLLASPRYGERWARHWLDLVRYSETQGHEFDFPIPNAYRYRDYVIRAFNADLPFDQFVTEHVAGDLLTAPRRNPQHGYNESIIGTGWFFFGEAKHSPVDVRGDEADRVDNQIDVFAKTFLGLTVGCARCHDHKFDAISTRDYYALAGYLQSSRYQQASIDRADTRADEIATLSRLNQRLCQASADLVRSEILSHVETLVETALSDSGAIGTARQQVDHVLHPWAVLAQMPADASTDEFVRQRTELVAQLKSHNATTGQADVFADFASPGFGVWQPTGEAFGAGPGRPFDWTFVAPTGRLPGQLLTAGAAHSGLVSSKLQGELRSPTFEITKPTIWYRVYGDGSRVRLIVDGLQLIRNPIYGGLEFKPRGNEPYWHEQDVSKWIGHRAYFELIDDGDGYLGLEKIIFSDGGPPANAANELIVQMLDDPSLTSGPKLAAKYVATCREVLTQWLDGRDTREGNVADRAALLRWVLELALTGDQQSSKLSNEGILATLVQQRHQIESALAPPLRALAMVDGSAENEHVFIRGNHKTLGDEVPRRFLEVLGGTQYPPPEQGSGRLELAQQLVSNPLLPRVIVNRLWHHHFGAGIVRTPDDFGSMGQPPTHPELLDYLAQELIQNGWSLKHVHRLILLSSTYQMSSRLQREADRADPQNKLWHRREVRRLEAESIRDAILFVSTRADFKMYGPGVMPYLTDFTVGRGRPKDSGPLDGDGRRSIYLAVRRNFLSPMFLAFDYPTPFTTIGRRGLSNVPAQALAMMNNPFVIEQAGYWADALLADSSQPPDDRVRTMYIRALSRQPDNAELKDALDFVEATAVETSPRQAWADLAHVLFNVKEFMFIP